MHAGSQTLSLHADTLSFALCSAEGSRKAGSLAYEWTGAELKVLHRFLISHIWHDIMQMYAGISQLALLMNGAGYSKILEVVCRLLVNSILMQGKANGKVPLYPPRLVSHSEPFNPVFGTLT